MGRIDTQGKQQGIERHLHHPGGGESIAHLPVSHAHHVNALRQPLKQGCDGATHASLPISMCRLSAANLAVSGGKSRNITNPLPLRPTGSVKPSVSSAYLASDPVEAMQHADNGLR